jgi:hypothetical protein
MVDRYWSWTFLDAHVLHEPLQAGVSTDCGSLKEALRSGTRAYGYR